MSSEDDTQAPGWSERDLEAEYDYERIEIPDDRPPEEYTAAERRAELYGMIREAGHPSSLEVSQRELGGRYGVTQQAISLDVKLLRDYRKELVGDNAISTTEFVAERAVRGEIKDGNFAQALYAQLRYMDFLFDMGELEKEPERLSLEDDNGEAYLSMLKAQAQKESEEGEEPLHEPFDMDEFDKDAPDPFDDDSL